MLQKKRVLPADGFTFKQFYVAHDRCAMKVGTDAVLLGAWTPVINVTRVLDIGCGSGVIALMLAQRTANSVPVEGVELDRDAAVQAKDNCTASPWNSRLHIYHADICHWTKHCPIRYSLIVSNPPWFTAGLACATPQRSIARGTDTLGHQNLLDCAERLIDPLGMFCVVMPTDLGCRFAEMALRSGWFLRYRTEVADNSARWPNRLLLALSPAPGQAVLDSLVIRNAAQQYSAAYRHLTSDFYLSRK